MSKLTSIRLTDENSKWLEDNKEDMKINNMINIILKDYRSNSGRLKLNEKKEINKHLNVLADKINKLEIETIEDQLNIDFSSVRKEINILCRRL